jgi:hypothetical protein
MMMTHDIDPRTDISASSNRRGFMTLFAGASLALAGAALTGCSGWDMRADPAKSRPKTYINGRQGGSGGNMRKDGPQRP